jgi:hypothetical protein
MSQDCGIKISIETTRISYRKMGIMATYSEAGNFPRDILDTLFLCGDCAEPWPWPFTTRYRARDEKRPSLGLLRICSYITLAIHQMRCWNRAGRISTLSERGQSCSSWSSPFAESVLCKTTGQRSQALRTWVQILYLACPPGPALQLIHGLRWMVPPRRSCGPLGVGYPQKSWGGPRCRMISEETDSSWHMHFLAPQIPSSSSFPSSRLPLHSSSTLTTFDDPAVLPRRGLLSALYPQSHPSRSLYYLQPFPRNRLLPRPRCGL